MKLHLYLLSAALLTGGGFAQDPAAGGGAAPAPVDPFARNENTVVQIPQAPKYVSICYESFSLPLADAAALRRQDLPDAKLYDELVKRTKGGNATQEYFAVVSARSGEKAMVEDISELIYPTAFLHRNITKPDAATAEPKDAKQTTPPKIEPESTAPALPADFETRNVGFTLEVEPTIGDNDTIIDLRLYPETLTLVDRAKWGQGSSSVETPVFETQRVRTALTLRSGVPMLIGTPSRPPASKQDPDAAKKVWFAFVTGDIVEVR